MLRGDRTRNGDLVDAFRLADATAAARAESLRRIGVERRDTFERLEQAGIDPVGEPRPLLSG